MAPGPVMVAGGWAVEEELLMFRIAGATLLAAFLGFALGGPGLPGWLTVLMTDAASSDAGSIMDPDGGNGAQGDAGGIMDPNG
jgi:hypothetical protein